MTAVIIASQLVGCAGAKESELLQMINSGQAITIEVADQNNSVDTAAEFEWMELARLTTYPEFRDKADDVLMVTAFGSGGKNGTMYVDLNGNHTDNSTLYYALMNKQFRNQMNDTDTKKELLDAVKQTYSDVTNDSEALVGFYNAYFKIFNDADGKLNAYDSISRAEFMSAVYRAENPVQDLGLDKTFSDAVDAADKNPDTIFAQNLQDYSYLNLSEKSMNNQTFNGSITRGEALYLLVQKYYTNEYSQTTGKEACFSDAKNAGNETIAEKQGFIEVTKDTRNYKDYWMSYELQYAIQNADKGCPEPIYKALVVAKNMGLITADECRWDEALTRGEAINFLVKIYGSMDTDINAARGNAKAEQTEVQITKLAEKLGSITIKEDGHLNISDEAYDALKTLTFFKEAENELIEAGLRYYSDSQFIDLQTGYDAVKLVEFIDSFADDENINDMKTVLEELGYLETDEETIEKNKMAAEQEAAVQESKPAVQETKPVETQPAVQETQSTETKPVETKPAETQPVVQETQPTAQETQPVVQETQPGNSDESINNYNDEIIVDDSTLHDELMGDKTYIDVDNQEFIDRFMIP